MTKYNKAKRIAIVRASDKMHQEVANYVEIWEQNIIMQKNQSIRYAEKIAK